MNEPEGLKAPASGIVALLRRAAAAGGDLTEI